MAISYNLGFVPLWYLVDLVGRPLGGGYLAAYESLDKTIPMAVYEDPAGAFPWPTNPIPNTSLYGILFNENGQQGPFFFMQDSSNPADTYYLEAYDANGVLQWTFDQYSGASGGGGSTVTTALNLENLITNNVMWRNIGTSVTPLPVLLKLAPGAHAGFAPTTSNAGPDILFLKNNTAATDQITFTKFTLGSTPLTGDVTPVDYLNYQSNTATGETSKLVQFPITTQIQNLTNQNVTVTIWARCNSGANTIVLNFRQFFGDGAGASGDVNFAIETLTLTNAWQKFTVQTTVPNVSTMVLGACGNSGLFLQIQYPLDAATNIDFTKPFMCLGDIAPDQDYVTYDMIDAVINAQRTGYVMSGFDTVAPGGFIIMNDGTIGSAASGASTRANIDTFPLYNLLWNNVSNATANAYAPVTGGLGGSAVADFTANKPMQLTLQLGRFLASAGAGSGLTSRVLGSSLGAESETLTLPNLPQHTHNSPAGGDFVIQEAGTVYQGAPNTGSFATATGGVTGFTSVTPVPIIPPVSFMNFFIKL